MSPRQRNMGLVAFAVAFVVFILPFLFTVFLAVKTKKEASLMLFSWPSEWHFWANLTEVIRAHDILRL